MYTSIDYDSKKFYDIGQSCLRYFNVYFQHKNALHSKTLFSYLFIFFIIFHSSFLYSLSHLALFPLCVCVCVCVCVRVCVSLPSVFPLFIFSLIILPSVSLFSLISSLSHLAFFPLCVRLSLSLSQYL